MERAIERLRSRRSLLWVCQRYDLRDGESPHDNSLDSTNAALRYRPDTSPTDTALASFFWEAAWFQGAASPLLAAMRTELAASQRAIAILASEDDASARPLSTDIFAAHVLPGIIAEGPPDARYGGSKARKRDKIEAALAARLAPLSGRTLVVIGAKTQSDLERLAETLEDEPVFDLDVVLWWEGTEAPHPFENAAITLHVKSGSARDAIRWLTEAAVPGATKVERWSIRAGKSTAVLNARDVGQIGSRYRLLTEADLGAPNRLTVDDLRAFLSGDGENWNGYAAGLAVQRAYRTDSGATLDQELRQRIDAIRTNDQLKYCVVELPAEGGAGATTLVRAAAFAIAGHGVPVLVMKPDVVDIDIEELLAFSGSLNASIRRATGGTEPLVLIADIEHSKLPIERLIPRTLAAHGRQVLILRVTRAPDEPAPAHRSERRIRLPPLRAIASSAEVDACRSTFERAVNRWGLPLAIPSLTEWQAYEQRTRWRDAKDHDESLFWVALRYFLLEGWDGVGTGPLDALGQWIRRRVTATSPDESLYLLLDSIAALSSARLSAPLSTVLRPITGGSVGSREVALLRRLSEIVVWDGYSSALEDQSVRFLHPSLADEYLRQRGASNDKERLERLFPTLKCLSAGRTGDLVMAELLATDIVPKWSERQDTAWDWRESFFTSLPEMLSSVSKPILHHWARCLYHRARQTDAGSGRQRVALLVEAQELLERATRLPKRSGRDENPSHLFNTLGTVCSRLARVYDESGETESADDAWSKAHKAFSQAIRIGDGGNIEALLAFAERLIERNEARNPSDLEEIAQALGLLDSADALTERGGEYDDETTEQLRVKALKHLQQHESRLAVLEGQGKTGLASYCRARLAEASDAKYGKEHALAILDKEEAQRPLTGNALEFYVRLSSRIGGKQYAFNALWSLYQRLEQDQGGELDYIHGFRHAVVCYQSGRFEDGARRFRLLRERSRAAGNTWPKLKDILRDASTPSNPLKSLLRVEKIAGDWRGTGYVQNIRQSVPFRPRHFSPLPREGDLLHCIIRFEFSGPLATPET